MKASWHTFLEFLRTIHLTYNHIVFTVFIESIVWCKNISFSTSGQKTNKSQIPIFNYFQFIILLGRNQATALKPCSTKYAVGKVIILTGFFFYLWPHIRLSLRFCKIKQWSFDYDIPLTANFSSLLPKIFLLPPQDSSTIHFRNDQYKVSLLIEPTFCS